MKSTVSATGSVLSSPGKAFSGEQYLKSSIIALMLFLYVCYAVSGLLVLPSQQTDTFKELQFNMGLNMLENRMAGATEEDKNTAIEAMRDQMDSPVQLIIQTTGVIFGSGFGLVYILMTWGLIIISSRMLGGEETPYQDKKHQRTLYLSLYAGIPLALSGLVSGVLVITKNPESYSSIITLKDYLRAMDVSPSLFYVFRPEGFYPGTFLNFLLTTFTDPFSWWSFAVLFFGIKSILRLDGNKAVIIIAVTVLVHGGLTTLLTLPAKLMGG